MSRIRQFAVFFGALILYLICLDRGASLWDCPEYILIAWRLEVGHPPGNPTWQLIANVVSHLGGDPAHAAVIINALSAVSMALASLFLSSIIYLLLRGSLFRGEGKKNIVLANLCGAGGALCYAWCDSAIFSAVEAEVYALSAMFTSLMLLLALKWAVKRREGDVAGSRRLIVLTAYLAGLGVGVHELNFLVLPAMALIYLYGKGRFRADSIPTAIFSVLLFAVGLTTYLIIPVRAAANPPVNQGDPSNLQAFISYYARDQYPSHPLLYGRTPFSKPLILEREDSATGDYLYDRYYLTENSRGKKFNVYPSELDMWFPRMISSAPEDIEFYESWAGMSKDAMVPVEASVVADSAGNQMGRVNLSTGEREKTPSFRPTYLQQARYFLGYQVGFMYFRYLLWNFSGRQNDRRGSGGPNYGNFITGIAPIDNAILGDQSRLSPELRENNKGYNRYFMIPFIFGLIGIVALLKGGRRGRRVCAIVALFFIFTGVLIVVYLNQNPGEPRDRDYSFLGSYMAYCIWIACGMAALIKLIYKIRPDRRAAIFLRRSLVVIVCAGVPALILSQTYDDHNRSENVGAEEVAGEILNAVEPDAILFANGDNTIFPLLYAQEVLGMRRDVTVVVVPYLVTDWYRTQLLRPGEGAPALKVSEQIPAGPGSISDRAVNDIVNLNAARPAYKVSPGKTPEKILTGHP